MQSFSVLLLAATGLLTTLPEQAAALALPKQTIHSQKGSSSTQLQYINNADRDVETVPFSLIDAATVLTKAPEDTTTEKLPFSQLMPGTILSGATVSKILPYGVLVQTNYEIPGTTPGLALLHVRNLNHKGQQPLSSLQVGQPLENVRVVSVNRRKGTVTLSTAPPSTRLPLRALQVGDEVEGKVVRIHEYGAFVDIGVDHRDALLHKSRMSLEWVHNVEDHVQIGQTVKVKVVKKDPTGNKNVAVSMLLPEVQSLSQQDLDQTQDLLREIAMSMA